MTPPQKTASWGLDVSASGRTADQPPANQDCIRVGEPCSYESASGLPEWLSRDPIAEEGGINLYAYVGNSPVRYTDRLGLFTGVEEGEAGLFILPAAASSAFLATPTGEHMVNQFADGVNSLGNAISGAISDVVFKPKNTQLIGQAESLMDQAQIHVNAAAGGPEHGGDDPNDRRNNFKKWLGEAREFLKQARGKLAKCTRDVSEQSDRANGIEKMLQEVEDAGLPLE